jgi:deoxyribodipyrimidine photo-lyase
MGEIAQRFAIDAMHDACGCAPITNQDIWANDVIEACERHQTKTVVTGYAPIGPTATALAAAHPELTAAGIRLVQVRRPFDTVAWPHATKGFFAMKKAVPSILETLGIGY